MKAGRPTLSILISAVCCRMSVINSSTSSTCTRRPSLRPWPTWSWPQKTAHYLKLEHNNHTSTTYRTRGIPFRPSSWPPHHTTQDVHQSRDWSCRKIVQQNYNYNITISPDNDSSLEASLCSRPPVATEKFQASLVDSLSCSDDHVNMRDLRYKATEY